jgi:hypothetical protein
LPAKTEVEKTEKRAIELLAPLTPQSRGRVIAAVQASMPSSFDPESDPMVARRLVEIDSGTVECIPHDEVMEELRALTSDAT